jgi:hypothetical protein
LFDLKICGLQWWRGFLIGWLSGLLFAALQAITHPFAHARLLTQMGLPDQSDEFREPLPNK